MYYIKKVVFFFKKILFLIILRIRISVGNRIWRRISEIRISGNHESGSGY